MGATGTIRENRTEKCPLVESKLLKKEKRGALSAKFTKTLALIKWHDNNVVTVASNCHSVSPVHEVERVAFVEKKRQKIKVKCPNAIVQYNKNMGGVDRFDENVDSLRVSLKGKKWWFSLFAFGLDAACQNSWQLYRKCSRDNITYCQFRRVIVQTFLTQNGEDRKRNARTLSNKVMPVGIFPKVNSDEHQAIDCSQRRCVVCHERTRKMCQKCEVALHIHCFFNFHCK